MMFYFNLIAVLISLTAVADDSLKSSAPEVQFEVGKDRLYIGLQSFTLKKDLEVFWALHNDIEIGATLFKVDAGELREGTFVKRHCIDREPLLRYYPIANFKVKVGQIGDEVRPTPMHIIPVPEQCLTYDSDGNVRTGAVLAGLEMDEFYVDPFEPVSNKRFMDFEEFSAEATDIHKYGTILDTATLEFRPALSFYGEGELFQIVERRFAVREYWDRHARRTVKYIIHRTRDEMDFFGYWEDKGLTDLSNLEVYHHKVVSPLYQATYAIFKVKSPLVKKEKKKSADKQKD